MTRKIVFTIVLTLLATNMLTRVYTIQPVKASGTIYIKADGSIDPPTAPIQRYFGVYTFIDNIFDEEIVVQKSNIIIDGGGALLQGPGSGTGFSLVNVNNITIRNVTILNYSYGIRLTTSSNNNISGNTITYNSEWGIFLEGSNYNNISRNNIKVNTNGVRLAVSNLNNFHNNLLINNTHSCDLVGCYNNTISENNFTDNGRGPYLYESSYNVIYGNTIANNDWAGVMAQTSSNNSFYHNNIINNAVHSAYIEESENVWNDTLEGNYWSDYTGTDANHDGIGDTAYIIDANNIDNHPLMGSFYSFSTPSGYHVNVISNSTIEDFEYFNSNNTIRMYASNSSAIQLFGFCRVSIPKNLVSPPYTVIIDEGTKEILHFNDTIHDNGTQKWIYFAYEHSTHKLEIIPEFPIKSVLSMALLATSLTVIVLRKTKRLQSVL